MRLMINVQGGVPLWTSLTTEKGGSGRGVAATTCAESRPWHVSTRGWTRGQPRTQARAAVSTTRRRGNSKGSNPVQRAHGRRQVRIRHTDEDGRGSGILWSWPPRSRLPTGREGTSC
jgi:hypothetical protein